MNFEGGKVEKYISHIQKWILEFNINSKKNFLPKESDWKLSTQCKNIETGENMLELKYSKLNKCMEKTEKQDYQSLLANLRNLLH